MVSKLKHFARDPMFPRKNRGAGWYYLRGHLTTGLTRAGRQNPRGFRGQYWSKYTEEIDGKKRHKPMKVRDIQKKEEFQPHKADYKTRVVRNPTTGRKEITFKTKRVPSTRDKGFF